jgi:hypothetical protein
MRKWLFQQHSPVSGLRYDICFSFGSLTTDDNICKVAKHVQGKSPEECRAKSFEEFASPNVKKSRKANDAGSHPPTKLYRAGSNLFKKQVREFIREVRVISCSSPKNSPILTFLFCSMKGKMLMMCTLRLLTKNLSNMQSWMRFRLL